jgi:ATP-dependent DNA helicase RecQ
VKAISYPTLLEQCMYYLLEWTYKNITYSRRQSLYNLYELCLRYEDSTSFKGSLDRYFTFTETSFVLQHIAEHPKEYEQWFGIFYVEENKEFVGLPEIKGLRDRLSRFLESYASNTGLNLISGLLRLFLEDYDSPDGRGRFENALEQIQTTFPQKAQRSIFVQILKLGDLMSPNSQLAFVRSITTFYPDRLEELADRYEIYYFLTEVIQDRTSRLTAINQQLYEQLNRI